MNLIFFQIAINLDPMYVKAYYHLSKAQKLLGQYPEAKIVARQGINVLEKSDVGPVSFFQYSRLSPNLVWNESILIH